MTRGTHESWAFGLNRSEHFRPYTMIQATRCGCGAVSFHVAVCPVCGSRVDWAQKPGAQILEQPQAHVSEIGNSRANDTSTQFAYGHSVGADSKGVESGNHGSG